MVNVAPVIIFVHDLLRLLITEKFGWKLSSHIITIEHKRSISLWLWP
jgi:hypothetical protein